jgi:hypothetical protein
VDGAAIWLNPVAQPRGSTLGVGRVGSRLESTAGLVGKDNGKTFTVVDFEILSTVPVPGPATGHLGNSAAVTLVGLHPHAFDWERARRWSLGGDTTVTNAQHQAHQPVGNEFATGLRRAHLRSTIRWAPLVLLRPGMWRSMVKPRIICTLPGSHFSESLGVCLYIRRIVVG